MNNLPWKQLYWLKQIRIKSDESGMWIGKCKLTSKVYVIWGWVCVCVTKRKTRILKQSEIERNSNRNNMQACESFMNLVMNIFVSVRAAPYISTTKNHINNAMENSSDQITTKLIMRENSDFRCLIIGEVSP